MIINQQPCAKNFLFQLFINQLFYRILKKIDIIFYVPVLNIELYVTTLVSFYQHKSYYNIMHNEALIFIHLYRSCIFNQNMNVKHSDYDLDGRSYSKFLQKNPPIYQLNLTIIVNSDSLLHLLLQNEKQFKAIA